MNDDNGEGEFQTITTEAAGTSTPSLSCNEQQLVSFEENEETTKSQCPICLCSYEDKCYVNVCMHRFCFVCILQWSEFNRNCPLCKTEYSFLIHNIQSEDQYDKHILDALITPFKRKPITPPIRRTNIQWGKPAQMTQQEVNNLMMRRRVYSLKLRAKHMGANPYSKFRDISPLIFRSNPDTVLRLVPWIMRDLRAILGDDIDVTLIKEYILAIMQQMDLKTQEAIHLLQPFLYEHTNLFIHELVSFARSPYDMKTYDGIVQYPQNDVSTHE